MDQVSVAGRAQVNLALRHFRPQPHRMPLYVPVLARY